MMCLYVDLADRTELDAGERRARKAHKCDECQRTIEPGETYRFWTFIDSDWGDGKPQTEKMCTHCWGTIELGAAFTGCPKNWFWGSVHDVGGILLDESFVADILQNPEHTLSQAQRFAMLRTVAGRRRRWRRRDGTLLPVPGLQEAS